MILVIDNFDSFTYNIVQYLLGLGAEVTVKRNDEITVDEIERLAPEKILVSPGPSNPDHAGVSMPVIRHFAGKIPVFGVCLGHQSIGQVFGGRIVRARTLFHGKTSRITHDGRGVFAGMPNPFTATRYHSLVIEKETVPADLEVSAWSEDGEIMGVRHRTLAVEGVQFHPESIATEGGLRILENFLKAATPEDPVPTALKKTARGGSLSENEAERVMEAIADGRATPVQMAALLAAMGARGETAAEMAGMARVLRRRAVPVAVPAGRVAVDTCGTGGDQAGTFNISTAAAFAAAGAGALVAKHGNRSASSRVGSADVLESLGVPLALRPERAAACLREHGIVFLFAPNHHPAMKHAGPVRKELGIRTVFNHIGPLANPAGAVAQVIGVSREEFVGRTAEALARLGVARAWVVHGRDGLDELTLTGPSLVTEIKDGWTRSFEFEPSSVGLATCRAEDLRGGGLDENKALLLAVLDGRKGPARDAVCLNAAAALVVAGAADDLTAGVRMAQASLDSGAARAKLESLRSFKD